MSKIRRQVRKLFESYTRDFTVTYSGAPGQLTWFLGDVSPEENMPMGSGGRKSRVCRSHAPKRLHSKMGSREAASSNKKALTEGQFARHFGGCSLRVPQNSGEGGPSLTCPRVKYTVLNWYVLDPHTPPQCAAALWERASGHMPGIGCSETGTSASSHG